MTEEEFRSGVRADGSRLMQPETAEVPLLTFSQAEYVGRMLHDRWENMTGKAPLEADDMAWGDIVQFVVRQARDVKGAVRI